MAEANVWLTAREVAKAYKLGHSTLARWRMHDVGPAYTRLGAKVLYASHDVEAFLEANRVPWPDAGIVPGNS